MKKLLSLAAASLLLTSAVMAQDSYSETRNVTGFSTVSFAVAGEVHISLGQDYKVVLAGDRDFVSKIETKVSGGDLVIKHEKWFNAPNSKVIVYITMPSLVGIDVSGSGKVTVEDPLKGDDFEINISGSGTVLLKDVTLTDVECDISGSGKFLAEGTGTMESLEINISGSGSYAGGTVKVGSFEASISGSGSCDCYVTGMLKAAISGSGSIYYSGNPKIDASISGSGRVRMK
ncbi:MAG TPA: head GIN domain-containing protein [Bacteroidales bacterium]|nr:head GIN domain-containing protein [Bacteroidales bacterium]